MPGYARAPCRRSKARKMRVAYCSSKPMPLSRTVSCAMWSTTWASTRSSVVTLGAAELERVAQQVLKELAHLQRVGLDRRHQSHRHRRPALLDAHLEVDQHLGDHVAQVDRGERMSLGGDAREHQQVVDQVAHPPGRVGHPAQEVLPLLGEVLALLGVQLRGEGLDLAQRLLQIVGCDRGELLELGVGARELGGMAQQLVGALQAGVARRQLGVGARERRAAGQQPAQPARGSRAPRGRGRCRWPMGATCARRSPS